MSGKNLTFKLIMDGDSKGLVAAAKQSEQVVSKVFEAIKQEANQTRLATNNATQGIDQLGKESTTAAVEVKKLDSELANTNVELSKTNAVSNEATKGIEGLKTGYTALTSATAALGVGLGIRELAQTADTYTNLSARINIATKEGGDFTSAMAGVHQVALMTNSSLEATGNLFTKINDAGKEMGMTQQQALDLTKTINQAIKIGGGSAQASEAAVQQFIQALQSGVLRGDEFNSIMEQAPGLTSAMAKGLGVTTGELRKMAEAGELSAERITKALQSQAGQIQATYDKFPTTIGNALQRITTSWEILIGKMDQANGASSTVAQWLVVLADNIADLDIILNDIGEGFVWVGDQLKKIDPATIEALKTALVSAYDAIKSMASSLGNGLEIAGDQINSLLGAIFEFNSGVDTAADKTNGLTKLLQALNVAFGFINDGFSGIAIAANLLSGAIYDVASAFTYWKSKLLLGDAKDQALKEYEELAAKAQEYYTKASNGAIGFKSKGIEAIDDISKTQKEKDAESVASSKAKLESLLADQQAETNGKKASEAEKMSAVQAYAEAAIKANGGVMDGVMQADLITKGYIVTIDEAGKVSVQAGVSAAQAAENAKVKEEALKVAKENVKKADEEYLAYQKQAAIERAALEQQIEQAKRTGDLNALASAQASLAGIDTKEAELANNRATRINELNQLNSGAGQVVEGAAVRARKAAAALGIDLDIALGRVSEKFAADQVYLDNYANGFDELGLKGEQATNALYMGWEKWLASAKSEVEIEAAKANLLSFGEQGKLSTSQVEMGLQAIKRAGQELPAALSPAEAAMARLGIQSKKQLELAAENALTDLDTVMKSGEATQEGLQKAYEETVRLAQASGNAQVMAAANAKAAYLGLEVQLDATGKATVSKLGEIQQAAVATQRTVSQVSRAETPSNPTGASDSLAGQDYWEEFKAKRAKINEATKERMALAGGKGGSNLSQLKANPEVSAMAPSIEPVSINTEPLEATSFGTVQVDLRTDGGTKQVQVMAGSEQNLLDALAEMKKRS